MAKYNRKSKRGLTAEMVAEQVKRAVNGGMKINYLPPEIVLPRREAMPTYERTGISTSPTYDG